MRVYVAGVVGDERPVVITVDFERAIRELVSCVFPPGTRDVDWTVSIDKNEDPALCDMRWTTTISVDGAAGRGVAYVQGIIVDTELGSFGC